ncbi:hypothetical protein, partial [Escherichia coli]
DDKGWDARKRAYCLKIQPATGSFARNLIYSTKPYKFYDCQLFHFWLDECIGISFTGKYTSSVVMNFINPAIVHITAAITQHPE